MHEGVHNIAERAADAVARISPGMKAATEAGALGTVVGTALDWLPSLAAIFAIAWHTILIYSWFRERAKVRVPETEPDG